jgi:hypothetical protein
LPAQVEEYDLGESEKHCEVCGLAFGSFEGTESSEVVEVEVRAYRRLIRRYRYRRVCQCRGPARIITAPGPGKLIPKGRLGVSVWVLVLLEGGRIRLAFCWAHVRRDFLAVAKDWSGELAAMLFSLLQTLLLWNINPRDWLSGYLTACAETAGNAPPEAAQWLPWNLSEAQQRELQPRQTRARDGP